MDKTASLTQQAKRIINEHATEYPHSGQYNHVMTAGTYLCRRCGLGLFRGDSQFSSGCGWPSFDADLPGKVKKIPDADGQRIEIRCNRCDAHLGHVFEGEHLTPANRRYSVNSLAIDLVSEKNVQDTEEAIVAGGCFWGVDYFLRQISGVLKVEVGFTGGMLQNPTYTQVCQGNTGHYEAVRILYDQEKTDYHAILKRFFEIHDPTQRSGQGPDLGEQYQSAIFYYHDKQYTEALNLIQQLKQKGYEAATRLLPAQPFWPAEDSHQDYYLKHPKAPYCHRPVARFE